MADDKQPTWEVVSQIEDFGAAANGQYVPGVRVSFRTRSGATGSVFIPSAEYTVDRAKAVIGTAAEAVETVQNLTG